MQIHRQQVTKATQPRAPECVTLDLGLEGFSECPQIGPNTCDFAVPFGYGFLCAHAGLGEMQHQTQPEDTTTKPAGQQQGQ